MQTSPTPLVVERTEQRYAGVTRTVTMTTMSEIADRIPVLLGRLGELGIAPVGAPFLRYLVIDKDRSLTVEAGVPVAGPVPDDEVWHAGVLPAGRYMTLTHTGHPDEMVAVTDWLLAWGGEHGHRWDVEPGPDGDHWGCRLEAFHTHPMEVSIDAWVTELSFRLAD